ncbi:MAG TPA: flavin reductase family protein [Alphaproteobacteria bacterium]|nr:flavin reductase family protein [Alphaproteobacteria bacterium]
MDDAAKKTALRMIPYGIYILTARSGDEVAAATVNWVTQTSFEPPLIAVAIKTDSGAYALIKKTQCFALNMLGKGQAPVGFTFFKPAQLDGSKISGEPFTAGRNGSPILGNAIASVECKVSRIVDLGDHHIFVGQVTDANVAKQPEARADDAILWMKDLGEKVFYGG